MSQSLVLVFLFCAFSIPVTATPQKTIVLIESFNLRYDNPGDGVNAWPKRQQTVLAHLQQTQPDVVGMQEVLAHQLDWLDNHLADYAFIGVGRDDGKRAGEFVPLLYNTRTLEKLDSGYFWLSETPDVAGSIGWLAQLPRVVTWAKFSHNNNIFFVFNAHFSHVSDLARQKSAEFLVRYIPTIAKDEPVILMGDLNTLESEPAYATILADSALQFKDSGLVDDHQPATTYNGYGQHEAKRIDYIFISKGLTSSRYMTHQIREGQYYISDHYPISAQVILPEMN
ncbi:endonuclease/exonuclease/phosphatase family protein [Neptunicella sp. SCSIO 80796]|uniref:endonuclease/exonuclease/phosphatase family protein n=1 Tax=Neptunicella plasticusilytica TaxID=3117012 RepID=UPI003A4D98B3